MEKTIKDYQGRSGEFVTTIYSNLYAILQIIIMPVLFFVVLGRAIFVTTVWEAVTSMYMLGLVIALGLYIVVTKLLERLLDQNGAMVAKINAQEGLALDTENFFGKYIYPNFFTFDKQHRKLAQVDAAKGTYIIRDFSWVLNWGMNEYEVQANRQVAVGSVHVGNQVGTIYQNEKFTYRTDYFVYMTVADPAHPHYRLKMASQDRAKVWVARLTDYING